MDDIFISFCIWVFLFSHCRVTPTQYIIYYGNVLWLQKGKVQNKNFVIFYSLWHCVSVSYDILIKGKLRNWIFQQIKGHRKSISEIELSEHLMFTKPLHKFKMNCCRGTYVIKQKKLEKFAFFFFTNEGHNFWMKKEAKPKIEHSMPFMYLLYLNFAGNLTVSVQYKITISGAMYHLVPSYFISIVRWW